MRRFAWVACAGVVAYGSLGSAPAWASPSSPEPWSDDDPREGPRRVSLGESTGVRAAAEYRANGIVKDDAEWLEHRLRADATLDWEERVRLVTSVDLLDGVLWGDNEVPGTSAKVATTNTSVSRVCLTQTGADATLRESYTLSPCGADPAFVRRLYGEVKLPVGLLRVGRQAYDGGSSVLVSDGDGRRNRFGYAYRGNNVDRVLFATKPLEALAPAAARDASDDRGVFLFLAYDRVVTGEPQRFVDDGHEWVTALRVLEPVIGAVKDVDLRVFHAYRWQTSNDTHLHALGARVAYRVGDFYLGADGAALLGSTSELTTSPEDVKELGVRAVARWDRKLWGAYLELDYASGQTATARSPLARFTFAEDTNVGLLLFEHVLARQSAQAAAADAAMASVGHAGLAEATRGAFTSATAIFPQVDLHPTDDVLLRGGVLYAQAPSEVVDRARARATGALVNYAGGRPATSYGTELDFRAQWRAYDHFVADVEAAVLLPGAALEDANGYAPTSWMVQGRTTFYF